MALFFKESTKSCPFTGDYEVIWIFNEILCQNNIKYERRSGFKVHLITQISDLTQTLFFFQSTPNHQETIRVLWDTISSSVQSEIKPS